MTRVFLRRPIGSDDGSRHQRFTGQEPAVAGHLRFGDLAGPVRSQDLVELSETEPPGHLIVVGVIQQCRHLV